MDLFLVKVLILPITIRDTASGPLDFKLSGLDVLLSGSLTVERSATNATRIFKTSVLVHVIVKVMLPVSGTSTTGTHIF